MIMSIQLLDFNKSNSSKSFMDDFIPTKEDQLTFNKLSDKHEEFLAKKEYDSQGITDEDIENETDDYIMAFGILELNYEYDIKENSGVPVNDDEYKTLGPVYGFQWRNFDGEYYNGAPYLKGTDQIAWIINEIKTNPDSRRIILSAWNPNQLDKMALPPCHTLAQFRVMNGKLSCQLYQRSADMFLGVPFNIASYSLLTHMLAQICNLDVGEFVWTGGDCHIYQNHMEQVQQQLQRTPAKGPILDMPEFNTLEELLATKTSDYSLLGYTPMPSIKAPMAV